MQYLHIHTFRRRFESSDVASRICRSIALCTISPNKLPVVLMLSTGIEALPAAAAPACQL